YYMAKENEWWTSPQESESGRLILVTGRKDIDKFRKNPKFSIRVEISWKYDEQEDGMPGLTTSRMMEEVTGRLQAMFLKDPVAVMTGIFTGDGIREWVFYTLSTNIFGRKLNEALADLPLLPLEVSCENDSRWEAYDEMAEAEIWADD
ncbi:MAG: DUF695 domain-containing protein, partial [Paramuribaculum sp.]|nr:DUF695 domain-containing protein [Paramuribaculum sp.]